MKNVATSPVQALEAACALITQAKEESRRGDVSHLIETANAVLRPHAKAIVDNDNIDVICVDDRVVDAVAYGYQVETVNIIHEVIALAINNAQTEIASMLSKALNSLDNAMEAKSICAGQYSPTSTAVEQANLDRETARVFVENDPYLKAEAESAQISLAEPVAEDSPEHAEGDGFTPVPTSEIWVPLAEVVDASSEDDCTHSDPLLMALLEDLSDDAEETEDDFLPPPPRTPSFRPSSCPPPLPSKRASAHPDQFDFPLLTVGDGERHEILVSFHRPDYTDQSETRQLLSSMAE